MHLLQPTQPASPGNTRRCPSLYTVHTPAELLSHSLLLGDLKGQYANSALSASHHSAFLRSLFPSWLLQLVFPKRVCVPFVDGPTVQSLFCTSAASFSGGGPRPAEHTCSCIFLGPPSRQQGHPLQTAHFILRLRCALLIFNLVTEMHRKEERGDAITKPQTALEPRISFAMRNSRSPEDNGGTLSSC